MSRFTHISRQEIQHPRHQKLLRSPGPDADNFISLVRMRTKSVIVDLSRSTANGCPSRLQCGYSKFRYTQTLYGGRWGSTSLGTSTFLMWNFNYSLSPGVCGNMIFICFSWNWELARLEFENLAKIVIWRWMIWKKIKKIGEALYRGPQGPIWPKTASKMALYDQKWGGGYYRTNDIFISCHH